MSLLLNMLSRLVITFLPRSKRLLISRLQSPSAVILEPITRINFFLLNLTFLFTECRDFDPHPLLLHWDRILQGRDCVVDTGLGFCHLHGGVKPFFGALAWRSMGIRWWKLFLEVSALRALKMSIMHRGNASWRREGPLRAVLAHSTVLTLSSDASSHLGV